MHKALVQVVYRSHLACTGSLWPHILVSFFSFHISRSLLLEPFVGSVTGITGSLSSARTS
jgi:hypothetical protein